MTRRRDLFGHLTAYACYMIFYFLLLHLALDSPFPTDLLNTIYFCIGTQTIMLIVSVYYVWRANIVKTKETPEYLIDLPHSTIYLLGLPTYVIFIKTIPFIQSSHSLTNTVVGVTSLIMLAVALCIISPILVEGIGLFTSSKYTKLKNKRS